MAWVHVRSTNATGSGTAVSVAAPAAPAVGNTLVFTVLSSTSGTITFSAQHDTIGNTYTDLGRFADATRGVVLDCWACVNTTASANTVSVTQSASGTWECTYHELSGGPAAVLQSGTVQGANIASGTNPIVTPSFTALAGDALINGAIAAGSVTFNSPWTNGQVTTNGDGAALNLNVAAGANAPNWSDAGTIANDASAVWGLQAPSLADLNVNRVN